MSSVRRDGLISICSVQTFASDFRVCSKISRETGIDLMQINLGFDSSIALLTIVQMGATLRFRLIFQIRLDSYDVNDNTQLSRSEDFNYTASHHQRLIVA